MNFTRVVEAIDKEIARLQQARAILAATSGDMKENAPAKDKAGRSGRRVFSAKARARIAAAQKKRWAAARRGK